MAEETNPPVEEQAEQPMMTFTQLEESIDQAKAQEDKGLEVLPGQEEPPAQQPEQVAEDPIAKALAESGFKSVEELVKSQKEGHATITKLSQERAALQRDMEAMAAFPQMLQKQMQQGRPQAQQPQPPQGQPDSLTLELFKDMAPFVDQLVAARAQEIASKTVDQELTKRALERQVYAKREQNPEEFNDLHPIMMSVLRENPHYEALPNVVDVVYEKAKEARDRRIANMAAKLFGTSDVDKVREAIKAVMAGNQPMEQAQGQQPPAQQAPVNPSAYVPPAGANTPPMTQKSVNFDSEIATRMKGKITPDLVDEIADLAWQKALSQPPSQNDNRPRR